MKKILSKNDDVRIKTRFLWFPMTIKGERRWLERASWEEKYYICGLDNFWGKKRWIETERKIYNHSQHHLYTEGRDYLTLEQSTDLIMHLLTDNLGGHMINKNLEWLNAESKTSLENLSDLELEDFTAKIWLSIRYIRSHNLDLLYKTWCTPTQR